ncbi:hypothetical protein HII36_34525 [Nonomuraea sp. NN258]|nr:hypothetical protein [Nonomuraea antri]
MWFLAGTFGGTLRRSCTVPPGRPLDFPLVNKTDTESGCRTFMATAKGRAVLDGRTIKPERLEEDDVLVTDAGVTDTTFACGLWVRLEPLKPGRHRLIIRGSSGTFRTGVDYTLTVQNHQRA